MMTTVKCANRACGNNDDGLCDAMMDLEIDWMGNCQSCTGEYSEDVENEGK